MLAIDLNASLGTHFPVRIEGEVEVDEEEVEANYLASLARHAAIYDENAKNIKEMHEAWVADREQAIAKVKSALSRRKEDALADNPREKLCLELIAAHKAKSFNSKNDIVSFIRTFILDHCPTTFSLAQIPKKSFQSATLAVKRKRKDGGEEEDDGEDYTRWGEMWVNLCLRELSDDESLNAALRNISFLTQIDVHFNFASESNLEEDLRRNEDERANSTPDRQRYRVISETAYERSLSEAYSKLDPSNRVIVYEGSIKSATISPQDRITTDEVNKILPFLGNKNFGRIARYMVVLSKLHWFRTNHHVGTDKEGIAKSLADALDRALRAMPVEDKDISENDVRSFFTKNLHTIAHWASTHLICGGLYMPSQKLISGFYHWVLHPRLVQKLSPEDDLRRRLLSAPTNLAKYYLVTAIALTYISSPGWGLYTTTQLREIGDSVKKTTAIQQRAKLNLDYNRVKIDSADSTALFRNFLSCRKDDRYAYHSSHAWMNMDSQLVLPECRSIGLAGMLVCAMHPTSTIARAPCFLPDGNKRITDMSMFGRDRQRTLEMNTSLADYDELIFTKLRKLALAMEASTVKNIRQLSQRIQFSSEAGNEVGAIARSLGLGDASANILASQMDEYLRDNSRGYERAQITNLDEEGEEEESFIEEEG